MDFFSNLNLTQTIIGACLGIGLSAASGFRVFLPLFALSLATHFNLGEFAGLGNMTEGFKWVGDLPALITLGVASVVEIFAYYIPVVDNFLDTIAIPLAGIAGTFLMASQLVDLPEVVTWTLAIIAGGGTAAAISGGTAATRATSTATTGGSANFVHNTAETGAAITLSSLAIFLPVIAFVVAIVVVFLVYKGYKFYKKKLQTL